MGQYFFSIIKSGVNRIQMPDEIHCEWVGLKLCERATNPMFVNALTNAVRAEGKPVRVATIGDYAFPGCGGSACDRLDVGVARSFCKGAREAIVVDTSVPYADILVNYDRKEYAVIGEGGYSPLVLLTAVGNGMGGGDYRGKENRHLVGSWAFDRIGVKSYDQNLAFLRGYKCLNEDGETLFPFEF